MLNRITRLSIQYQMWQCRLKQLLNIFMLNRVMLNSVFLELTMPNRYIIISLYTYNNLVRAICSVKVIQVIYYIILSIYKQIIKSCPKILNAQYTDKGITLHFRIVHFTRNMYDIIVQYIPVCIYNNIAQILYSELYKPVVVELGFF